MAWRIISDALALTDSRGIGSLLASMRAAIGIGDDHHASDRASFTAAVIGLAAKLSKSDGISIRVEAETFERLFPVPEIEIGNVRRLFKLASQDVAGYEIYAGQVARALVDRPALKRDVFEALLLIASADGILHPGEDRFLAIVADRFDYTREQYLAMRSHFIADADDPYSVLGMSRDAGNAQLKAHYLKLVREHHPDALAARGLAVELRRVAERKLAIVNAAWDAISRERGL